MPTPTNLTDLHTGFADPPIEAAPMMRWWWFGPDVDRAGIDRQLTTMARAGLGGVEVSYVYPLGDHSPELLSPPFLAHLRYAAERTAELGMRFDLTLGSGWSFGGPHIGPEHAARRLQWDRREITPGAHTVPVPAPWPGDELVAAFVGSGSLQEEPDDWQLLEHSDTAAGTELLVPDGTGPRVVLLGYSQLTGQQVKRAAAGAEGPVFDHYSAAATAAHLTGFCDPLLDAVPAELITSVFCDSLEVYEADWTPDLITEFTRRRGYDPRPLLHRLASPKRATDLPDEVAGFRADVGLTLTELYEDHCAQPLQQWAAGRGVDFRIQGYGAPPAGISSYRFADRFEGEGWGWTELTQTRWATSAAHLYGRAVCSSETWTWVHSPSLRATPLDLLGEAHEHALLGVNHFIGHGWPYNPDHAPGLGNLFYASAALDDRNPWWGAAPQLFGHLTRLAWLLRQGTPVADVAVYVPMRDVHARLNVATGGSLDAWKEAKALIDPGLIAGIRTGGWDYDLIDDDAIVHASEAADRPVVVVPACATLTDATRRWLTERAAAGRTVLVWGDGRDTLGIDGATFAGPGGIDGIAGPGGIGAALRTVLEPDLATDDLTGVIGHVHRRIGDLDAHLVVNTGDAAVTTTVRPRVDGAWQRWDPATGTVVDGGPAGTAPEIAFEPYQAVVLVIGDVPAAAADGAPDQPATAVALTDGWTAHYPDGSDEPVTLPHRWDDDPAHAGLSGTVVYRTTLDLDEAPERAVLDLGPTAPQPPAELAHEGIRGKSYRTTVLTPVGEVAEVIVNGGSCGTVFAPPYRVEIGDALEPGENTVEIAVSNTGANALAHDSALPDRVAASRQRYGRRFVMQDLARATDGATSGLLAVPRLLTDR